LLPTIKAVFHYSRFARFENGLKSDFKIVATILGVRSAGEVALELHNRVVMSLSNQYYIANIAVTRAANQIASYAQTGKTIACHIILLLLQYQKTFLKNFFKKFFNHIPVVFLLHFFFALVFGFFLTTLCSQFGCETAFKLYNQAVI
jgi:hypothetical protein